MIDFGILLTPGPIKEARSTWLDDYDTCIPQFAGLVRSLWMSDHLFWADMPTYEAWTVMSFLAAHYPQFDIASGVLGQSYRNPALLAKMAATLQELSNKQVLLGIGAGWKEDEYTAYGYPYPPAKVRLEQLADSLEIIRRLWHDPGKVTYQGKHYQVTDAYCEPKPQPPPLIVVGGGGNTTMRLAAHYADMWNLSDVDLPTYLEKAAQLKAHCASAGRTVRLSWLGRLVLGADMAAAAALRERAGVHHYGGWKLEKSFAGTPAQVIAQIQDFAAQGIDYFIFEIVGLPDPAIAGMAREVFAAFKKG